MLIYRPRRIIDIPRTGLLLCLLAAIFFLGQFAWDWWSNMGNINSNFRASAAQAGPFTGTRSIPLNAAAVTRAEYVRTQAGLLEIGLVGSNETTHALELNTLVLALTLADGSTEEITIPDASIEVSRNGETYARGTGTVFFLGYDSFDSSTERALAQFDIGDIASPIVAASLTVTHAGGDYAAPDTYHAVVLTQALTEYADPADNQALFTALGTGNAISGDFTATVTTADKLVLVDATGITASGVTITGYAWDWGDETPTDSGVASSHYYAAAGRYPITCTVTLSDGTTLTYLKEISMATITSVTPAAAKRGEEVTIVGTGFGASQTTGTVEVGGVELTSVTWADTEISGTLAATTPMTGMQDVVITPAEPGTAVTAVRAIFVYDATNKNDKTLSEFKQLNMVFIDGRHVGFCSTGARILSSEEVFQQESPDRVGAVQVKSFHMAQGCRITINQMSIENLELIFAGTKDAASGTVFIPAEAEHAAHSIMLLQKNGRVWIAKEAKIVSTGEVAIDKNFDGIETEWRFIQPDDPADSVLVTTKTPAAA